jgi:hypothetical protein
VRNTDPSGHVVPGGESCPPYKWGNIQGWHPIAQVAHAFASGRATAYYEVVSFFINQATSFDLNLEAIEVRIGDDDILLNRSGESG